MTTLLITGAAGNLGSMLARRLLNTDHQLRLMTHRKPLSDDLASAPNVEVIRADLARPETLVSAVQGADCVAHFAGVLFKPWPERFLPTTNLQYFRNLLDVCLEQRIGKMILISFPQVEGETTPEHPATGRLDGHPRSVHAQTRLAEERLLMERCEGTSTVPIVLRTGMMYGPGILMIEGARWLLKRRLLPVWPGPTHIHVISTPDMFAAMQAAIQNPAARGIYHLGDEKPLTLQEFLDRLADTWGYARPVRLPVWMFYVAAFAVEVFATVFRTPAPLHRDFIRIGTVSYVSDTTRMREELLPHLQFPTIDEGLRQFD